MQKLDTVRISKITNSWMDIPFAAVFKPKNIALILWIKNSNFPAVIFNKG
jgi:hypothetical protein